MLLQGLIVALAVVVVAWLALVAVLWLHRPTRAQVGPALRLLPDVLRLVRSLLADGSTPAAVRLAIGGLLVYLVSPLDLIPEFLPGIGSLDDVILAAIVLRWSARRLGVETLRSHWPGSAEGFDLLRRLAGV